MKNRFRQRGSAAVELAILMTFVLVPLAFGITEFGRAIYQYNAITKGVRDGARHLTQYAPGDATRISEARCLAAFGTFTCPASGDQGALVPGLTKSNVTVRDRTTDPVTYKLQLTGRGPVNLVAVEVSGYVFNSLFPFAVPDIAFDTISATMEQVL